MIILTGHGSIAEEFSKKYPCEVISIRTMTDIEVIEKIKIATVVIHNSSLINSNDIEELLKFNFLLTKRIVDLINQCNIKCRFINLSSMSFLKTEDKELPINEMSNYALSKYLAEHYCLNNVLKNVCSIRFSTLFYQNPNRDGLSKIIHDAFGAKKITIFNNGIDKRDFIPIQVAVDYLYKISQVNKLEKIYNVVSGKSVSFMDLVKKIKKYLDFNLDNVNTENKFVLSEFSSKHIESLGIIEFDIEDYIDNYIKCLNEFPNL